MENTKYSSTTQTFVLNYADGTMEVAKPVSWSQLEDVELLQFEILKNAAELNFCLGDIFKSQNTDFWNNAVKLAAMIPIVGNTEPGFDPKQLADMDQLCSVFITTTSGRNFKVGGIDVGDDTIEPSLICKIHYLNFIQLLVQTGQIEES